MRTLLLAGAALWTGMIPWGVGAAQRPKPVSIAQVILMSQKPAPGPVADSSTPLDEPVSPAPDAPIDPAPPAPAAFRAHDLSRKWVEFEMANSFAGLERSSPVGAEGPDDPFAHVGVADLGQGAPAALRPPPAIAIPAWMKSGMSFAVVPTSFSPGCAAGPYKPSGFLAADAEYRRSGYYEMMSSIACEYGIPVGLFDAMIIRESQYKADIFSPKRAFGLTQLMPETAAGLGVNRFDTEQNLRGGARYLRQQLDRFGQVHLALAAYNAGPGRVQNGTIPRIAETQAYVENVLLNWRRLAGLAIATNWMGPSPRIEARQPQRFGRVPIVSSY